MTKKVHMMGIGGMGMVALAGLFKEKGWEVQGSDKGAIYPPASDEIARLGISVFAGYSKDNITQDIDLVIVGNVISTHHEEYQAVLEKNIPYTSMAQALGEYFLNDKESIVICGTHGKTTTSSLMAYILNELKQDPSFFIGGIPHQFQRGYQLGTGKYFVLEGDEYDTACFEKTPKFLHYKTKHLLLTSIEFDHADIYESLDQIMLQFHHLFKQVGVDQALTVCGDDLNIQRLVKSHQDKTLIRYGVNDDNDWVLKNYDYVGEGVFRYEVFHKQKKILAIETTMMGQHNAVNAVGCLAICHNLGLDLTRAAQAIGTFKGVTRRQQLLSAQKHVYIYDDFAHHPTAVERTLTAFEPIAKKNAGRLWALFEPRSNTARRSTFQAQWPQAFSKASVIVMTKVYKKEDGLKDLLDLDKLKADLEAQGKTVYLPEHAEQLVKIVCDNVQSGDTLLFMSNGDFGGAREKVLAFFNETA